jgi:hypothetical protein
MNTMRSTIRVTVAVTALVLVGAARPGSWSATPAAVQDAARASLPSRLSDADFWALVTEISEPGGYFRITDNFTSNEPEVGVVSTMLREARVSGGVYLGVGPEQNFSYIAATRPDMAFVVDIRRQAVMQHLMFKAIFEMSADRADFIATLFAKPRPAGLDAAGPIQKIWDAFAHVPTDEALSRRTYGRVVEALTKTHGFSLTADEASQLGSVFDAFQAYGPSITTRGGGGGFGGNSWTFADLTGGVTDAAGVPQSFLSSDANYRFVKGLEDKNLVVPVSGDFGGPKTLRAIGAYVRDHHATVSGFYVSNVEQYLFQDGKAKAFFDNVGTLPILPTSVFIRPYSLRGGPAHALCPIGQFLEAVAAGRVSSNSQALACGQ